MNRQKAARLSNQNLISSERAFQITRVTGRMDDNHIEFFFGQTQKLRNSLASVRSLSEILHDNLDIEVDLRQKFLTIILTETEKLTRMIEHVSDIPEACQLAKPV